MTKKQDPYRCETCGTLLEEVEGVGIVCPTCDEQYGECKTCPLPPECCGSCGLGDEPGYNLPEAEARAMEREPDVYDLFEQVDWGDGSLSPEAEERKAALDHRGRP